MPVFFSPWIWLQDRPLACWAVDDAVGAGDVDDDGVVDGAGGEFGGGDQAGEGGEAGGGAAAAEAGAGVGAGGDFGAGPDVEGLVVDRPGGVFEVVFEVVGLVDDGHVHVGAVVLGLGAGGDVDLLAVDVDLVGAGAGAGSPFIGAVDRDRRVRRARVVDAVAAVVAGERELVGAAFEVDVVGGQVGDDRGGVRRDGGVGRQRAVERGAGPVGAPARGREVRRRKRTKRLRANRYIGRGRADHQNGEEEGQRQHQCGQSG